MYQTKTHRKPRRVQRHTTGSTYRSKGSPSPLTKTTFAVWGLMTEIIGAACVVFGIFTVAILLTIAALMLWF